jgi:hypothetical protein
MLRPLVESTGWSPRTGDALVNIPMSMIAVIRRELLLMLCPLWFA